MIQVRQLKVNGLLCYEVRNTLNDKASFIPFEEDEPESLWNEVKSILRSTKPKYTFYRRLRIIANMDLDSNLPEEIPVVLERTREIHDE